MYRKMNGRERERERQKSERERVRAAVDELEKFF